MPQNKPILVTQSSLPPFDEYCRVISSIWDSHHLTNMGPCHEKLADRLKEYLQVNNVTLYANGHLALENMLEAYKLHGEVITTPFTFVSTTNALVRKGLQPVFCDIKENDYTIDPQKIEPLITEKTCAILAVHVYGHVCEDDAIFFFFLKYRIKFLYVVAHAFGVKKNGVSVANLGDCSMFSFHATKVFNTVEGGALCYNDDKMRPVFDTFKNFGMNTNKEYTEMGGNAKMSEFHAAMGLCNLLHLENEISKRKVVFERYVQAFNNINGIKLCLPDKNTEHNYAYMPVLFTDKFDRDTVYNALAAENIFARKYFYPLTNDTEWFHKKALKPLKTPIAEFVAEHILCLPLYSELSVTDTERIINIVLKTVKN